MTLTTSSSLATTTAIIVATVDTTTTTTTDHLPTTTTTAQDPVDAHPLHQQLGVTAELQMQGGDGATLSRVRTVAVGTCTTPNSFSTTPGHIKLAIMDMENDVHYNICHTAGIN